MLATDMMQSQSGGVEVSKAGALFVAERIKAGMREVGPKKIAACTTDAASNMVAGRNYVEKDPDFCHVIFLRCFMHGFSLLVGSLLGYSWARDVVADAQRVVTYFRASHAPGDALRHQAKEKGIKQGLQRANGTRFTSVHSCLDSVHKLEKPLGSVVEDDKARPAAEKIFPKKFASKEGMHSSHGVLLSAVQL